jgi:hypothetical protein
MLMTITLQANKLIQIIYNDKVRDIFFSNLISYHVLLEIKIIFNQDETFVVDIPTFK